MWTSVDVGVLSWLAAVLTAGVLYAVRQGAADGVVLGELATTLYLALLFFAIRIVADEETIRAAAAAMVVGATVAAALGVIGFALSELDVPTPLAFSADSAYPYLGNAARARALTTTPNMLASILMLALLLLGAGAARVGAGSRRLATAILGLGFVLTFSKTLVPLAAGGIVVWALRRRSSRLARLGVAASWLAAAAVFSVFSHAVLLCGGADREQLEQGMFITGRPLRSDVAAGCNVYPTNYFFNKRASLIAIERSWPWGIGPGRHPAFVGQLQTEGAYPEALWLAAPHSSYTGAAAELGLPGVLGLGAFLGGLALGIREALRQDATRPLAVAAAAALAALLIEAVATDVMHFRHYTWLAALVGSAAARSRS